MEKTYCIIFLMAEQVNIQQLILCVLEYCITNTGQTNNTKWQKTKAMILIGAPIVKRSFTILNKGDGH